MLGIEQKIYNRLDEGVKMLYSIKEDTKLDEISQALREISSKSTVPMSKFLLCRYC